MYDDIKNIVSIFTNDAVMYPYINQFKTTQQITN
jgi:hypothetical protein